MFHLVSIIWETHTSYKMASKIIKLLETTDTILGVHRNYVFLSKKSQFFCKLRVLGELMLCIIFAKFLFDGFVGYTKIYLTFEIFSFISSFNALFILLSSIITSSTYKSFIENLLVVDSQYRYDLNYIKKSKKLEIFSARFWRSLVSFWDTLSYMGI